MAPRTPAPSPPPPSGSLARPNQIVSAAASRAAAGYTEAETMSGGSPSGISAGGAQAPGTADGGGAGSPSSHESSGCGRGAGSASGNANHPSYLEDHVARMQADIERTTRRLEIEKRRLHELGESSRKAQHEFQDKRLRYSFNKAGAQAERLKAENNVLLLENRLSQALCKLNSGNDDINKLKALIDKHRKDRLAMEKVYRHMHRELAHHTEHLTHVKEKVSQLQEWEHQSSRRMDELNKAKEHEREAFKQHCLTMQKELREQDRQIKEFDIRTHRESSMQRTQMKGSPYSLAEEEHTFNPESLMKLIFKTALLNAVHRHNIRQYKNKISVFEKAMESIKTSTGISDAEEIVSIFSQLEERNYSVMAYVNNINVELESLETKKRQLELHMQQQAHHDATAQRLTDETLRDVAAQISNTMLATEGKNALIQRQLQGLQQSHEMLEATAHLIGSCWKGPHTSEEPPPRKPGPFGADGQRRDLLPMLWFIQKFFEMHKELLREAKDDSDITAAIAAAHAWADSYACAAATAQAAGGGMDAASGGAHAATSAVHLSAIRRASFAVPYASHAGGYTAASRFSDNGGSSGTSSQGGVSVPGPVYLRGRSSPIGFAALAAGGAGDGGPGCWGSRTIGNSIGNPMGGNNVRNAGGLSLRKTTCPGSGYRSSTRAHAAASELRPFSTEMQLYTRKHLTQPVMGRPVSGRRSPTQQHQRPLSALASSVTTAAAAASATIAASEDAATGPCDAGAAQRCTTADSCTETSAEAAGATDPIRGDNVTSGCLEGGSGNLKHGARTKAPAESRKTPSEEEEDEEREEDSSDEKSLMPVDVVPLSSEELRERTIHLFNRMRKKKAAAEGNNQPLTLYLPEKRCLLASSGTREGLASLSPLILDVSNGPVPGSLPGAAFPQYMQHGAASEAAGGELLSTLGEQAAIAGGKEGASEREVATGGVAGSESRPAREEGLAENKGSSVTGNGAAGHAVEEQQRAQGRQEKTDSAESGGPSGTAEDSSRQVRRSSGAMSIKSGESDAGTTQKKKTLPRIFRQPGRMLFGRQKEKQYSRIEPARGSGAGLAFGVGPPPTKRTSLSSQLPQQQQQQPPQQPIRHTSDVEKKPSSFFRGDPTLWGKRRTAKQLPDRNGIKQTVRSTCEGQSTQLPQQHQQQSEQLRYAFSVGALRALNSCRRKSSNTQDPKEMKLRQQQLASSRESVQKQKGQRVHQEKEHEGEEPQKQQECDQHKPQQQAPQKHQHQDHEELRQEGQRLQQESQQPCPFPQQPAHSQQQETHKAAVDRQALKTRIYSIIEEVGRRLPYPEVFQKDIEQTRSPQPNQQYVRSKDSPDSQDGGKGDAPYKELTSDNVPRMQGVKELGHSLAEHWSGEITDTRRLERSIQQQQKAQVESQQNHGNWKQQIDCSPEQQLPLAWKEQNSHSEEQLQQPSLVDTGKEVPSSLSVVLRQAPVKNPQQEEEQEALPQHQILTEESLASGLVRFTDLSDSSHDEIAAPPAAEPLSPMSQETKAVTATREETLAAAAGQDAGYTKATQRAKSDTVEKANEERTEVCFSSRSSGSSNDSTNSASASCNRSDSSSSGLHNIPFDLGKRKSATVLAALWERCESIAAEEAAAARRREQLQQRMKQTTETDSCCNGSLERISSRSYAQVMEIKDGNELSLPTETLQHRLESAAASDAARQNLVNVMERALVQLDSLEDEQVHREKEEDSRKEEQEQQSRADSPTSSSATFYASSLFSFFPENRAWNLSGDMSSSSCAAAASSAAAARTSGASSQAATPASSAGPLLTEAESFAGRPQAASGVDVVGGDTDDKKSHLDLGNNTVIATGLQQQEQQQPQQVGDHSHAAGESSHSNPLYLAVFTNAATGSSHFDVSAPSDSDANSSSRNACGSGGLQQNSSNSGSAMTRNAAESSEASQRPGLVGSGALPPRPSSGLAGQSATPNAFAASPAALSRMYQGPGLSAPGTPQQAGSPARPRSPLPPTVAAAAFQAIRTATLSSSTIGADAEINKSSVMVANGRPGSAAGSVERHVSAAAASTAQRGNSAGPKVAGASGLIFVDRSEASAFSAAAVRLESPASSLPASATAYRAPALSQPDARSEVGKSVLATIAASVATVTAVDEITAAACAPVGTVPLPPTPANALQVSSSPVPFNQGGTSTVTAEADLLSTHGRDPVTGRGVAPQQQQEAPGDQGTVAKDREATFVGEGTQKPVTDDGKPFQSPPCFSRAPETPMQQRRVLLQKLQAIEPGGGSKSFTNHSKEKESTPTASPSGKGTTAPTAPPTGNEGAACLSSPTKKKAFVDASVFSAAENKEKNFQSGSCPEKIVAASSLDNSGRPCNPSLRGREPAISAATGIGGVLSATPLSAAGPLQFLQSSLSPASSNAGTRPQSRGGLLGGAGAGGGPLPRERVAAAAAALAASSGSSVGRPATASPSGTLTPAAAAPYGKNVAYVGAGGATRGAVSPATLATLRQRRRMSSSEIYSPIVAEALNGTAVPSAFATSNGGRETPGATAAAGEEQSQTPSYRRPSSPAAIIAAVASGAVLASPLSSPVQGLSGSCTGSSELTVWRPASPANRSQQIDTEEGGRQRQPQMQQQKPVTKNEEKQQKSHRPPHPPIQSGEQYASINQRGTHHQVQKQQQEQQQAHQQEQQGHQQETQQEQQRNPPEATTTTLLPAAAGSAPLSTELPPAVPYPSATPHVSETDDSSRLCDAVISNQHLDGGRPAASGAAAERNRSGMACAPVVSPPRSPPVSSGASTGQSPALAAAGAVDHEQERKEKDSPSDSSSDAAHADILSSEGTTVASATRAGITASVAAAAAATESTSTRERTSPPQAETVAEHGVEEPSESVQQLLQAPAALDREELQQRQAFPGKPWSTSSRDEPVGELQLESRENKVVVPHETGQMRRDLQGAKREDGAESVVLAGETANSNLRHPHDAVEVLAAPDSGEATAEQKNEEPRDGLHRAAETTTGEHREAAADPKDAAQLAELRFAIQGSKGNESAAVFAGAQSLPVNAVAMLDDSSGMNHATDNNQASAEVGVCEQGKSVLPAPPRDATAYNTDAFRLSTAAAPSRPATASPAMVGSSLAPPLQSDEHRRPASVGSKHVSLNLQEEQEHGDEKEQQKFEQQQHPYWQQPLQYPHGQQRRSRQSQYTRRSHMSLLSSNRRSTRLSNAELFQFSPPDLQPPEKDSPPGTPPSSSSSRPHTAPNPAAQQPAEEEAFSAVVEGSRFVARVSRVERLFPQQLNQIDEGD